MRLESNCYIKYRWTISQFGLGGTSKDPPSTWQVVLVRPKTRTKEKDHLLVNLYFTSSDTTKKETSLDDQVSPDLSNEWFNRTPIIFCRYILNGSKEHP